MKKALVMLLLAASPFTVAIGAASLFFPTTLEVVHLKHGERVFRGRCGSCHSLREADGMRMGPNLARFGETAALRRPGMSAVAYAIESVVAPGAFRAEGVEGQMPENLAEELKDAEVRAVVGYILSRSASVDWGELLTAEIVRPQGALGNARRPSLATIEAGAELFRGKGQCSTCHSLAAEPAATLRAPSLLNAGAHDRGYLFESIVDPNASIVRGYDSVVAILTTGEMVPGRLLRQSDHGVTIFAAGSDGTVGPRALSLDEIASLERPGASPMPPYENVLTSEELGLILDFLGTLRSG